MEAPDGHCASNGQCSPGKENSRILADMSTPNGQTVPRGANSPDDLKIKEEEEMAEEGENRSPELEVISQSREEGVVMEDSMIGSPSNMQDGFTGPNAIADAGIRQPNGERPFQCPQCGVSFTQKGNLLRHIKLHTGEKPFKCPFCSYACRRRDALTGHLRTHAVGKPHKCNYCGRSYKQRTSLEEHKERCHSYLQGIGLDPGANTGPYLGDSSKEPRPMAEVNSIATFDRPPVIERLHSNVGKRKSTTPQKFVGEKIVRSSYPEMGYEMGIKFEKQSDMIPHIMDHNISNAVTYLGSESLRPLLHHPGPPISLAEVVPIVNPMYHHVLPLGQRTEHARNCDSLPPHPAQSLDFPSHTTSNGPTALSRQGKPHQSGLAESPSNSGADSADSARSSPQERQGFHRSNVHPGLRPQAGPVVVGPSEPAGAMPRVVAGMGPGLMRVTAERPVSHDGVRVFGRDGQEVRAFQCEHCRVLFLDHVMYTIHMGCHGYREPLECNICGHRSKDRYEFSSHIVRGEHTFH
ncbi:zinc finger protein Helios isoform X2 [Cynoglossus semilaevis]|uniref:IKAROS family zinc finger 2 n=2 Tax=Cynoglossus semilaevis TaxID=244447 RepID=A0A3P8VTG6_CYNSE|nr:zinc finger protein Helios isoform X2 [Cynoglossus semilaevis]